MIAADCLAIPSFRRPPMDAPKIGLAPPRVFYHYPGEMARPVKPQNPKSSTATIGIGAKAASTKNKSLESSIRDTACSSRYIHTSGAETYRPIAEIVEELKVIEAGARETDKALGKILKQLGI